MSMEVHPGTEKEVHLVSACAGSQAGDLTRAELADDAKRGVEIPRTRAGATLAVYAGGAIAWVEANILIIASNLESPVFLGLGGSRVPPGDGPSTILRAGGCSYKPRFMPCCLRITLSVRSDGAVASRAGAIQM